jgi:hypothetical protein
MQTLNCTLHAVRVQLLATVSAIQHPCMPYAPCDDSRLLVPPAYISADMPLAQKKAIAAVRLAAAPIECNTKHRVAHTQRKCQRCGIGVEDEHHLLFDCSHAVLVANRTKHRALFDGVSGVREWMAAAYKPD